MLCSGSSDSIRDIVQKRYKVDNIAYKELLTKICASLGLRMKFKTLFMSDDIGRLDCSPL